MCPRLVSHTVPNNDDDGDKLTKESAILSKSQNCLAVSLYFFEAQLPRMRFQPTQCSILDTFCSQFKKRPFQKKFSHFTFKNVLLKIKKMLEKEDVHYLISLPTRLLFSRFHFLRHSIFCLLVICSKILVN